MGNRPKLGRLRKIGKAKRRHKQALSQKEMERQLQAFAADKEFGHGSSRTSG